MGLIMPAKSTFTYPKPSEGLFFEVFEEELYRSKE